MMRARRLLCVVLLVGFAAVGPVRGQPEDARPKRVVYPLQRQSAKDLAALLTQYVQGEAQIAADTASNSLLIAAPQAIHDELKAMLARLDRPVPDVQVDCWILDLAVPAGKPAEGLDDRSFRGGVAHVLSFVGDLEKKGLVKQVQHVRLRTQAMRPAMAMLGKEITMTNAARVTAAGVVQRTIERRQVGTIFRATPMIGEDGKVLLDWQVERSFAQEDADGPVLANDELGRPIRRQDVVVARGQGKASLITGRMQPLQGIETIGSKGGSRMVVLIAATLPDDFK